MQTAYPEKVPSSALFSRERRRKRMLEFLQAFERRSWRNAADAAFVLPISKADFRDIPIKTDSEAQK